jgi:hypothetical protein
MPCRELENGKLKWVMYSNGLMEKYLLKILLAIGRPYLSL